MVEGRAGRVDWAPMRRQIPGEVRRERGPRSRRMRAEAIPVAKGLSLQS